MGTYVFVHMGKHVKCVSVYWLHMTVSVSMCLCLCPRVRVCASVCVHKCACIPAPPAFHSCPSSTPHFLWLLVPAWPPAVPAQRQGCPSPLLMLLVAGLSSSVTFSEAIPDWPGPGAPLGKTHSIVRMHSFHKHWPPLGVL